MAVSILMLKTLTVKCGSPGCSAYKKSPCSHVPGSPNKIPHTLKSKHRVINVERNHFNAMVAIACAGCNKRGDGTRLINSLFKNLSVFGFFIIQELIRIYRVV